MSEPQFQRQEHLAPEEGSELPQPVHHRHEGDVGRVVRDHRRPDVVHRPPAAYPASARGPR
eukprot:1730467-Pyramimonas_sp.AAC.1